ncbi:putative isomerase YddE [Rosistilla carotiformis]|uniref:Putative isomerase YddE n=1 Tax=Rosistilla carotiformis TaxID=2528017 RepID=A0A518JRZ8_9BACT|nr:PhzF family phenazine biosynthesis protein [Rosistilla carotiformis]QDV68331.1 putative isomerase YddE [Rosistilla carotiformis]
MSIRILQIDAFTDRPFAGNPAAVCLLEAQHEVDWMQDVASEMNLSETAFVRPIDVGYELRWFTPEVEVDLCGHATLAAAHALWTEAGISTNETLRFQTRSGQLTATRRGALIQLDFPATRAHACDPPAGLIDALQVDPVFVGKTKFDSLVVIESEATLRALQPDFSRLAKIATRGVIVTCRSESPEFDFVSRFFGPAVGIDEDPVTGSAHCCLAPYWGPQLGKTEMLGYQASSRGGVVKTQIAGDRILLSGAAVTVLRGELV